jgi:hypothetical protein
MTPKTIKLPSSGLSVGLFSARLLDKGVATGDKFCLKFKKGKRWKLKKFHLIALGSHICESCGGYNELTLKKGDKFLSFDNHFGTSWLDGNAISNQLAD